MSIYLVEDEWENFYPLTLLRPLFEIKCGRFNFFEKLRKKIEVTGVIVRKEFEQYVKERYSKVLVNKVEDSSKIHLFLKANVVYYEIPEVSKKAVFINEDEEVVGFAGIVKKDQIEIQDLTCPDAERIKIKAKKYSYPWQIIKDIEELIKEDIEEKGIEGVIDEGVFIYERDNLYLGKDSKIEAGVILDARKGKIFIDEKVLIKGPTIIEGPCFIGKGTIIDGAKIRPACVIGEVCRIGGEVEASIFHGYSNKHHEGFIGHAYIGEWVNLGALTTNSDLKNNYSNVKISLKGKTIDTGMLKFGCIIGDHTKTGIGTLINTGTVIGIFANIFGGGVTPKEVPSFAWGKEEIYQFNKLIDTLKKVMKRRNKEPEDYYIEIIKKAYTKETNITP